MLLFKVGLLTLIKWVPLYLYFLYISIFIMVINPTLNNNIGTFNLPHIWNRVLLNTQDLNLKRQINSNSTQSN